MANYVLYTRANGDELKLKINSGRAVELEERLGASIPEKIQEIDKLSVASDFISAAIPDGDYKQRKQTALDIYDEMCDEGKTMQEYQLLISDILVKAGFLNGKAVEAQRVLMQQAQEKAEKLLAKAIAADLTET